MRPLFAILFAFCLAACAATPRIMESDPNSVTISYGSDIAATEPLARSHCARFEKRARLADSSPERAYYDCVPP